MSDLLKQLRHQAGIFRKGGANGRADLIGNAADLIEQQAEEIDALKAHVEMMLDAIDQSGVSKTSQELSDLLRSTPQQSLAEHDAEVARKAFIAGVDWWSQNGLNDALYLDDEGEAANEYANALKRGEI